MIFGHKHNQVHHSYTIFQTPGDAQLFCEKYPQIMTAWKRYFSMKQGKSVFVVLIRIYMIIKCLHNMCYPVVIAIGIAIGTHQESSGQGKYAIYNHDVYTYNPVVMVTCRNTPGEQ